MTGSETEDGIVIRHVQARDHLAIAEIMNARHVNLGTQRLPYHADQDIADRIADAPGKYKLVAEIGGAVAGYGELETWPDRPRLRHGGEIDMVAVHPSFRGRRVGRVLLDAMIALARDWLQLSRLQLFVWDGNERALELYRSAGFEIEGRLRDYVFVDGEHRDAFIMSILLGLRNGGK